MNKYDRMIEMNRERSDEKIAAAKLAIRKLLDQGETGIGSAARKNDRCFQRILL